MNSKPKKTIKDHLFTTLFFPKVVQIDRPGIITNISSKKYGAPNKKRTIYYFEDIFVKLQLDTIKKLGKTRNAKIGYILGKNIGTRYLLLAKTNPVKENLKPLVIEYVFSNLCANGMSMCKNISFDPLKNSLILEGEDNIIWRKTKDGHVFSGMVSGILSMLNGKNIEAVAVSQGKICRVLSNETIPKIYIPNLSELTPLHNYTLLNFPNVSEKIPKTFHSFSDLVRFGMIYIDKEGKHTLNRKTIVASEVGLVELIGDYYSKIGELGLFEKSVIQGAESIFLDIFDEKQDSSQILKNLSKILCALGFGIPLYKLDKNQIDFYFWYPPISKYESRYLIFMVNGFLNKIFNKKFVVLKTELKKDKPLLAITYRLSNSKIK